MRHILSRPGHVMGLFCVLVMASAPATATLMIGPDVPSQPASPKLVRLADAEAVATGSDSKLSDLEAGGMLAASVLFTLMLWRGSRTGRQGD